LSKLYDVLSFKNVHFMHLMIDKYMKLNSYLRDLFLLDIMLVEDNRGIQYWCFVKANTLFLTCRKNLSPYL
jgi:hypothetical protein